MFFAWLCLCLIIHLIQTALFSNSPLHSWGYPDVTIALVVLISLFRAPATGLNVALAAGVSRELMVSGRAGVFLLMFLGTGLLVQAMREKLYHDNILTLLGVVFGLSFCLEMGAAWYDLGGVSLEALSWRLLCIKALCTAACAFALKPLCQGRHNPNQWKKRSYGQP